MEDSVEPSIHVKELNAGQYYTTVDIDKLYLLMGRELEPLNEVPAGSILGMGSSVRYPNVMGYYSGISQPKA